MLAFDTSGERPALLAAGITDDEGRFALQLPPGTERAALLGKLRGETLAPVALDVELPAEFFDLDARGPFSRLTATIESDVGFPDRLDVTFDPVAIAGLPERLTPFATQKAVGAFEGHYVHRTVTGRQLTVALAAGTWRLGAVFIVQERPMIVEPDFSNYVVDRVLTEDGSELPRERGGFVVQADSDVRLTLVLREVADSELG